MQVPCTKTYEYIGCSIRQMKMIKINSDENYKKNNYFGFYGNPV